jgi:type IV secretion system protein VirD4
MTPGYLGTYNWRSTLLGLFFILTTNIITTQHIAAHFDYQPALGAPLFKVSSIQIYAPYKWFVWILHFGSSPNPLIRQPLLYSTLITAIGFAATLFIVALLNIHQNRKLTENTEDLHGSARWANEEDIQQSGLTNQKHGVYIGAWHDEKADRVEYLKHAGPEHILAFAPTRSGKGVGLVIPSLLGWEGSAVIFDIKGENWDRTAGYRVAAGHVCFRLRQSKSIARDSTRWPRCALERSARSPMRRTSRRCCAEAERKARTTSTGSNRQPALSPA